MNPFEYLIKNLNHHAYFIHSFENAAIKLKEYLKDKFNIDHNQNPDFIHNKYELIGIDESRLIKESHNSKSFEEGKKKIYIIEADSITNEAQNSLLKIFEEPHTDVHFFIILPQIESILPTLRSRLNILGKVESDFDFSDINKFIKLSKKEKIDFVDNMAKEISDDNLSKKDAIEFLNKLEAFMYKKGVQENSNLLNKIIKAKDYIKDKSSSIKQLLEYVVLNMD